MKKHKTRNKPLKTNKTIRFPIHMIKDIEKAMIAKNCTFSSFVVEAVKSALKRKPE